eukprot:TRINITY_DN18565_c0_g1_i2.p1 TRINITY_DN18565_c0_g1~~TRINITY_DN18565_c0_g1_i2.p1  ORF type:complete len:706 (+),score=161.52 TRINITY_DN18565_c0_g1_i2:174-2291(+)
MKGRLFDFDPDADDLTGVSSDSDSPAGWEDGEHDLREFGKSLGLDLEQDADLRWVVEEAFVSKLPPTWSEHTDEEGRIYFCNQVTQESSWSHPMDTVFKEMIQLVKAVRAERPPANARRKAQLLQEHMQQVHQRALAHLDGWSGPYPSAEAGQCYYYNKAFDVSTWDDPVLEWQAELALRQKVLYRLLLENGDTPAGSTSMSSTAMADAGQDLPQLPLDSIPRRVAGSQDGRGTTPKSLTPGSGSARASSPSSSRSFQSARSVISTRGKVDRSSARSSVGETSPVEKQRKTPSPTRNAFGSPFLQPRSAEGSIVATGGTDGLSLPASSAAAAGISNGGASSTSAFNPPGRVNKGPAGAPAVTSGVAAGSSLLAADTLPAAQAPPSAGASLPVNRTVNGHGSQGHTGQGDSAMPSTSTAAAAQKASIVDDAPEVHTQTNGSLDKGTQERKLDVVKEEEELEKGDATASPADAQSAVAASAPSTPLPDNLSAAADAKDTSEPSSSPLLTERSDERIKVLFRAVMRDDVGAVEQLAASGVDVLSVRNSAGMTPLQLATERDRAAVCACLQRLSEMPALPSGGSGAAAAATAIAAAAAEEPSTIPKESDSATSAGAEARDGAEVAPDNAASETGVAPKDIGEPPNDRGPPTVRDCATSSAAARPAHPLSPSRRRLKSHSPVRSEGDELEFTFGATTAVQLPKFGQRSPR